MKKYFSLILFLSFQWQAYADWDLFPLNQGSFFSVSQGGQTSYVYMTMDTIVNRGTHDALFFNRHFWNSGSDSLYPCIANTDGPIFQSHGFNMQEMDSLYLRNDTVFYNNTLYFLPQTSPGQSWPFNGGIISCTAADTQSVFGILDSVKVFSYNSVDFILSKSYGFISYVPFIKVLSNTMISNNLVGLENSGGATGQARPLYLDFFPYQPGDILFWKQGLEPIGGPYQINRMIDSITSANYGLDTIRYTFNRMYVRYDDSIFYSQNNEKKFVVRDMIQLLEAPTNWVTIVGFSDFYPAIYQSLEYVEEADNSLTYKFFDAGDFFPDPDSCYFGQVIDYGFEYNYNTAVGFTKKYSDVFFPTYEILEGSIIGGVIRGDTMLHVGISQMEFEESLTVFPNPAKESLTIKSGYKLSDMKIYDGIGRIVLNRKLNDPRTTLDISTLNAGIYVIEVTEASGRNTHRKILKQ